MFNCKQKRADEEFYKKYPIGMKFKYLGIDMIINQNWNVVPGLGRIPALYAHYKNDKGEICCLEIQSKAIDVVQS